MRNAGHSHIFIAADYQKATMLFGKGKSAVATVTISWIPAYPYTTTAKRIHTRFRVY